MNTFHQFWVSLYTFNIINFHSSFPPHLHVFCHEIEMAKGWLVFLIYYYLWILVSSCLNDCLVSHQMKIPLHVCETCWWEDLTWVADDADDLVEDMVHLRIQIPRMGPWTGFFQLELDTVPYCKIEVEELAVVVVAWLGEVVEEEDFCFAAGMKVYPCIVLNCRPFQAPLPLLPRIKKKYFHLVG